MLRTKLVAAAGAVALMALAGAGVAQTQWARVDHARLSAAENNAEWLNYGRSYSEQRFSPLEKVNAGNVAELGLAWFHEFDTDRGQEATPIIVDGVMYVTTAWSKVYAFDAKTGKPLWDYSPEVDGERAFSACCDVVNRGVAVWQGKVYVGALDGRLIALDAKTGKVVWQTQTTDKSKPYTITGAPRVVKGKVLIGNGGAEYGVRGYVSAYDARTGKLAWRFYTTPNPNGKPDGAASDKVMKEKASSTWFGEGWKESGGGGTVWDAMAYDPDLDILYVGVGNGSPWNHQKRSDGKGDNLFLSSILALKPDTGEYVWHYQTTPGDSWDYTATQHIMVADLPVKGEKRRVVMQAPKNGFFYVLDAKSGALISAEKYVPVNWAEKVDLATGRPVESPTARYERGPSFHVTGPLGGHNWQPMAYHPKENLVYIPAMVMPGSYRSATDYKFIPGAWNLGQGGPGAGPAGSQSAATPPNQPQPQPQARIGPTPPAALAPRAGGAPATPAQPQALPDLGGRLIAWDPVTQTAKWTVRQASPWNGGLLATGGGLVFGGAGKTFNAYGAGDGKKLWSYPTGNGVIAAPATYMIDGEQYVAVLAGWGGAGGINSPEPRRPGRLLVFKLGGKVQAPAYPPYEKPAPLDFTQVVGSKGDVPKGQTLYGAYCGHCHSGGVFLPSLRTSPYLASPEAWKAVVHDGALRANGMAGFARFMNADEVEHIRAYLIEQVRPKTNS